MRNSKSAGQLLERPRKPEICVLVDHYLPGYKAGGPIQSIANLVEWLGDEYDFRIITSDRDLRSKTQYRGIRTHCWTPVGKALVMYLPPGYRGIIAVCRLLRDLRPRVLYLNSLFSRAYSLFPMLLRRLSLIAVGQVLLAPRGELSEGSLRIKALRKSLFLSVARHTDIFRDVLWQASAKHEERDIRFNFFDADVTIARPAPVFVARDLGKQPTDPETISKSQGKPAGEVRIVFLSRICRKKNLHSALETLRFLKGRVQFTVYGPIEDRAYWRKCQAVIAELPFNVTVRHAGEIPHDLVVDALQQHDVFFLPTLGENFGHVILEAFQAGCPVVISDQTPWRDLEAAGVGWDISLSDTAQFRRVLQACLDMPPDDFNTLCQRALEFGRRAANDANVLEENRRLLLNAIRIPG